MNNIPKGKPLPPKFSVCHDFDWHRTFTLKERFFIAIGCTLFVRFKLLSVNSPGAVQPVIIGKVSKHKTALDLMIAEHDARNAGPTKPGL